MAEIVTCILISLLIGSLVVGWLIVTVVIATKIDELVRKIKKKEE